MNCYIALMLKNVAMSVVLMALPLDECREEANRINMDPQYKIVWAYCEVKDDKVPVLHQEG